MRRQIVKTLSTPKELLIASIALTLLLMFIPFGDVLALPIAFLNTQIHELMHAVAAIATGGSVKHIEVYQNSSGVTLTSGGIPIIIASAGYVGASIVGAAMISFARSRRAARRTLMTLLTFLTLGLALWLRGDLVGVTSAIVWIALLALAIAKMHERWIIFVCQFIGVQQCLASIQSLLFLFHLTRLTSLNNDAQNVASLTGLPAVVWSSLWILASLLGMGFALRRVWLGRPSSSVESPA